MLTTLWQAAATSLGAGFIATDITEPQQADIGFYDVETGGGITYEFIFNVPEVSGASSAFMGSLSAPEGDSAGFKFDQWPNSGTYGATAFGVADYTTGVEHTVGEDTHVAFVSDGIDLDVFVNGVFEETVFDASLALSGLTGLGHAYNHANEGSVDPLGGTLLGVAVYDEALSDSDIQANFESFSNDLRLRVDNVAGETGAVANLTWNQPPTSVLPGGDPVTYVLTVSDSDGNELVMNEDACDAVVDDACTLEITDLPFETELTYELFFTNASGSGIPTTVVSTTAAMPEDPDPDPDPDPEPVDLTTNLVEWQASATSSGAAFIAGNITEPLQVDIGQFDIETDGGISYEFIFNVPEVAGASSAFMGSLGAPEGDSAGFKFDQWQNSGTYGATAFGVADFTSGVEHTVGEDTHVVFVADGFDLDIFVNGFFEETLFDASAALSGLTGLGHAYNHGNEGSVDPLGGTLLGVAVYDEALNDAAVQANYESFLRDLRPQVENFVGDTGAASRLTWSQPPQSALPGMSAVTYTVTVTDSEGNEVAANTDACDAIDDSSCQFELDGLPYETELTYEVFFTNASGSGTPTTVVSTTIVEPVVTDTSAWEAAATDLGAGFIVTNVMEPDVVDIGLFDIETGGGITYEIIYNVPEVAGASSAFLGSLNAPEGDSAGLKFDQWPNSGTYGATAFGVADFTSSVAHSVGENAHVTFVANGSDLDIFVDGEFEETIADASVALSGLTGIGHAYNHDTDGSVDPLGGTLLGVAVYDEALPDDAIRDNYEAFADSDEVDRLQGDANEDGTVDFADFLILSANFGAVDAVWADGDFDENGTVDFADFLVLSGNFGQSRE